VLEERECPLIVGAGGLVLGTAQRDIAAGAKEASVLQVAAVPARTAVMAVSSSPVRSAPVNRMYSLRPAMTPVDLGPPAALHSRLGG
jgi:hypothetical protein